MRKTFLALAVCTAITIGLILGYQYGENYEVPNNLFQQNVNVADLQKLGSVTTPEFDVAYSWEMKHIDGATTTINLINFATSTNIAAFYSVSGDSLNIRIDNYTTIKRYGEAEKSVPIVDVSILVHELVHLTTLRNFPYCKSNWSASECQERMAYDAGYIYEQIVSLDEDGLIKLSKN